MAINIYPKHLHFNLFTAEHSYKTSSLSIKHFYAVSPSLSIYKPRRKNKQPACVETRAKIGAPAQLIQF